VREALDDPVGTIGANVLGSTNVLDAVRGLDCAVVMVTSDKVYRNDEGRALVEEDRLGGLDPYGASKAAVELIADCYRHTYGVHVATARCANVIGGGDWGAHRIVPNCLKAFDAGQPVTVHDAVRVFLHVLDAVHGYAVLAERLASGGCAGAYNFGPYVSTHVEDVASMVAGWTGNVQRSGAAPKQEAQSLVIESRKARDVLDWRPRWPIRDAVERTVAWHRAWRDGADMGLVSMEQIGEFREAA
jgi:CDP-glucose 4,6-dehydratase